MAVRRRKRIRRGKKTRNLRQREKVLLRAMRKADARGYTGMLGSKGSLFDDPDVKRAQASYDRAVNASGGYTSR